MANVPPDFIEYPKWLYHRCHGGRVFNNATETRWLWLKGWRDQPYPERNTKLGEFQQWWLRWEWLFKCAALLLGLAAGAVTMYKAL